jgi:hypothetical protein
VVRIFCAHKFDTSGGSIDNPNQVAADLQVYGLGDSSKSNNDKITISGSSGVYATVYAPKMPMTLSGGGNVYGAMVALSLNNSGGSHLHYDMALKGMGGSGTKPSMKQISWRQVATPASAVGL